VLIAPVSGQTGKHFELTGCLSYRNREFSF
jgi:hypothetical protein